MEFDPIIYRSENYASIKPENNYKTKTDTKFEIYQNQRTINMFKTFPI